MMAKIPMVAFRPEELEHPSRGASLANFDAMTQGFGKGQSFSKMASTAISGVLTPTSSASLQFRLLRRCFEDWPDALVHSTISVKDCVAFGRVPLLAVKVSR